MGADSGEVYLSSGSKDKLLDFLQKLHKHQLQEAIASETGRKRKKNCTVKAGKRENYHYHIILKVQSSEESSN